MLILLIVFRSSSLSLVLGLVVAVVILVAILAVAIIVYIGKKWHQRRSSDSGKSIELMPS